MGSVRLMPLPTRFHHAGNLPLAGQFPEADPTNLKPPNVGAASATGPTAIVLAARKLRGSLLLNHQTKFCHDSVSFVQLLNGMPKSFNRSFASASVAADVTMVTSIPRLCLILS